MRDAVASVLLVGLVGIGGELFRTTLGMYSGTLVTAAVTLAFGAIILRRRRKRDVTASSEGLFVEGEAPIAHDRIRHTRLLHESGSPTGLRITPHAGPACTIVVDNPEDASRLNEALALTDAHRLRTTFTFGLSGIVSGVFVVVSIVSATLAAMALNRVLPAEWASYLGFPLQVALTSLIGVALGSGRYRRAELAGDGVRISSLRPGAKPRYIAYAHVREIRHEGSRVLLELSKSAAYTMQFLDSRSATKATAALRDARANVASHDDATTVVGDLERGSRSPADWLASLRAIGSGAREHYRRAASSPNALRAVIASSATPPSLRVAAAIVLTETEGASVSHDLRRLAAQTGDPRVERGLLRVASGGSDDELASALAQAHADERDGRTSAMSP